MCIYFLVPLLGSKLVDNRPLVIDCCFFPWDLLSVWTQLIIKNSLLSEKTKDQFSSVQFSHSVVLSLCDPMDCSMPGFPVHHQLLELAQTHVHQVSDAIQTSNPLSFPSPGLQSSPPSGSFQMSQLFTSGGQSIGVSASALSFQWIFRTDFL